MHRLFLTCALFWSTLAFRAQAEDFFPLHERVFNAQFLEQTQPGFILFEKIATNHFRVQGMYVLYPDGHYHLFQNHLIDWLTRRGTGVVTRITEIKFRTKADKTEIIFISPHNEAEVRARVGIDDYGLKVEWPTFHGRLSFGNEGLRSLINPNSYCSKSLETPTAP